MQQWEAKWLMEINPDKCEVNTVANKRSHINFPYNTHDKELAHVQHAKYLGLTFNNKLRWNKHIYNIAKKANATCAFLRRNINSCLRQVKAQCFTMLVLSNLEYAATVWDPYAKSNINKLEKMPMPCCQICEWGLLKRKQCYIYAKGTKMATFTTKKNQHKNGNDVEDSPPPYIHTISNVPYSCNHQNNKRPSQKISNTNLENIEPPRLILPFSNTNME